jgi:hypothetical protein
MLNQHRGVTSPAVIKLRFECAVILEPAAVLDFVTPRMGVRHRGWRP